MLKSAIKALLGPKNVNKLMVMRMFAGTKTEVMPSLDKILLYWLYRFHFFRNAFLRSARETLPENPDVSSFADFRFSEPELKKLERDGMSSVFSLKPETREMLSDILSREPIEINGRREIRPLSSYAEDTPFNRELDGVYRWYGLIRKPEIFDLATSPDLLRFASAYLRADTIQVDVVALLSFPNKAPLGNQSDGKYDNAQNFHYDHDHRRTLKLFFYLTDCDAETGAHVYVKGTHAQKPFQLQVHDGWRLRDQELAQYIPKDEKWTTVCGKAGSGFFVDPYGMHKGSEPKHGHRILMQVMYGLDPWRNLNYSTFVNVSEMLGREKPSLY